MTTRTTTNEHPRCPKCGEPPRRAIITARVGVDLYNSETPSITKGTPCRLIERIEDTVSFSCGGGHVWSEESA